MNLSQSGRVLLIDDKYEEVKLIIDALNKNLIPSLYFDGSVANLPVEPAYGIRFVFLDIELKGMEGQKPETMASSLAAILKRVISPKNGPYFIIFWTDHKEIIEKVIANCKILGILPISYELMEKSDFLVRSDGEVIVKCDLEQIVEKIETKLAANRPFQLYIEWENIVNTSSIDLVNEMASVVNPTANWAKDTSSLFYALYKAVVDNNITDDDQTQRLKYAFHLMNKGFSEVLESRTAGSLKIPTGLRIENSGLNSGAKAKINSMLHVTHVVNRPFIVGCVYEDHQPDLLKDLANNIFKEDQIPSEKDMKLCSVIITPACDIAQNKMFKTKGKDAGQDSCLHRVLFGLMFKSVSPPLKDKAKEARSEIALIWYNNEEWWIVFHFGTLTSMIESQIKGSLMFAIKSDMLFDLQSKAANHVNRLGKYLLK